VRVFESGAILLYLAEKFGALPAHRAASSAAECLSWLFWQMGSAPYLGGGFGHFYAYAPTKIEYAIDRFAMEAKRQLDVLNRRLAESRTWPATTIPWPTSPPGPGTAPLVKGLIYEAGEFLRCTSTPTSCAGPTTSRSARPCSAGMVNRATGPLAHQLHERHDASDFDTRTQDKLQAQ
jgi:GST-like protein